MIWKIADWKKMYFDVCREIRKDPTTAARELQRKIQAPSSVLTVWAWRDDTGLYRLIVRVDPSYPLERSKVPSHFRGMPVEIQSREIP